MLRVKDELVRAERLTDGDGGHHYFYGYYDNPAFSGDGKRHLCHRVSFWDRLPEADDTAVIGVIDVEEGEFLPVAETTAWNFQQGSMLQWNPASPDDEIIYNVRGDGDYYRAIVQNLKTGERRELSRPVANVSQSGEYGLSISFERMFDFRPGYGYAGHPDPYWDVAHPEQDGVFLVDMVTGENRLVLSLDDITRQLGGLFLPGQKLLINHITFNTDGSRFIALVRNFMENGKSWKTIAITANRDGSDMYVLSDYGHSSHYHWRDPEHIVVWNGGPVGPQLYVLKDKSREIVPIDTDFFLRDGHCSYSYTNTDWLLYDSYPDDDSYRHLYLYHTGLLKGIQFGSYYSDPTAHGDIRSDLHPRWNPAGTAITFDSTHEGRRDIYMTDITQVMKLLQK
jgi:hypothetical protein